MLALLLLIYIPLGCFLEPLSIMVIMVPITLPVIVAMQRASAREAQVVVDYLHSDQATDGDLQQVITLLHKYDTLQSTMAKAHEHITQAKQCLQDFGPSPVLDTLYNLADYVVARDV